MNTNNNNNNNLFDIYKEIIDNEDTSSTPKDSQNFFNIDKIDLKKPVFRVFPIERLLQLIIEKKNTLVKPRMWDDPWENFLLNQEFKIKNDGPYRFGNFRENFYGQCWTLNSRETDALWRIYSPDKNGVRIRTNIAKLFDGFYDQSNEFAQQSYFMGKIQYISEKKIREYYENPNNFSNVLESSGREMISTLLIKRKEFKHENEVRLIYTHFDLEQSKEFLNNDVFKYNFEPLEIIEQIIFDPRFDNALYKSFKKILVNCGFKSKIIKKSKLYQIPKLDLNLD